MISVNFFFQFENRIGTKSGVKHYCRACHGRGVRVQYRPVLLLMQQQICVTCEDCNGEGNGNVVA